MASRGKGENEMTCKHGENFVHRAFVHRAIAAFSDTVFKMSINFCSAVCFNNAEEECLDCGEQFCGDCMIVHCCCEEEE